MGNSKDKQPERPTPPPNQSIKENQDPLIKPQTTQLPPPPTPTPSGPDKKW